MQKPIKLGECVVCGSRVHKAEEHLKTAEGYCHRNCLITSNLAQA